MRKIILLVCFLLTPGFFFIACKKDDKSTAPPNKAPIANAGLDKTITRLSCGSALSIDLDGSGSSDPDNNMLSYVWRNINLPSQVIIKDSTKASTSVFNISIGQYAFELKVTDAGGLSSKDTILVNVIESEYNLDITINGTYNFEDNHPNCYYLYYNYDPCPFNDITTITCIKGKIAIMYVTKVCSIGIFRIQKIEFHSRAKTARSAGVVPVAGHQAGPKVWLPGGGSWRPGPGGGRRAGRRGCFHPGWTRDDSRRLRGAA